MTLHSRDVQKRLLVSASDIKRNQCRQYHRPFFGDGVRPVAMEHAEVELFLGHEMRPLATNACQSDPSSAHLAKTRYTVVTVQVVKTGLTPQIAPSDHLREAEKEQLHPAEQLHTLR